MKTKLMVMTKGNKSYIKASRYSQYRVNGFVAEQAPGNPDWIVTDSVVASIEERNERRGEIVGFERLPDAPESLPAFATMDACDFDPETHEYKSKLGYDLDFYQPRYSDPVVTWTPVEFEVIDRDCEPVEMESWVVVDWPANIERYREQQHKFPCHITAKELFKLTSDAVIEVTSQHRQEFDVHDCRSIGVIAVAKLVEIPQVLRRKETVDDTPWGSKRKRTKVITRTTRKVDILRYNGFYDRREHGEIFTPQLSAPNYAALKQAVQEHIESIVAMVQPERWCLCESCGGTGIKEVPAAIDSAN